MDKATPRHTVLLPDVLAAGLCRDSVESSNCLRDTISLYPCTPVFMLGTGFGVTVIFPYCLASLHSHSRSIEDEQCSREKISAVRIHTNKCTDCTCFPHFPQTTHNNSDKHLFRRLFSQNFTSFKTGDGVISEVPERPSCIYFIQLSARRQLAKVTLIRFYNVICVPLNLSHSILSF